MEFDRAKLDIQGSVGIVTLNHPEVMNAVSPEMLGPYSQLEYRAPYALDRGKWAFRMLSARGGTIAAGTNQIQHNIIGERVLGLPKG